MAALAALGIQLAIDDFGTGHSSLARLGEFPCRFLKIDRSFVRGLPDARAARTLVTAIMYLAKGFGLLVVAEGVETEAQRDFLLGAAASSRRATCSRRPVEPAEIAALAGRTCQYASRPNFSRRRW